MPRVNPKCESQRASVYAGHGSAFFCGFAQPIGLFKHLQRAFRKEVLMYESLQNLSALGAQTEPSRRGRAAGAGQPTGTTPG